MLLFQNKLTSRSTSRSELYLTHTQKHKEAAASLLTSSRFFQTTVNDCIAKWRLGACDIQELPLVAASS